MISRSKPRWPPLVAVALLAGLLVPTAADARAAAQPPTPRSAESGPQAPVATAAKKKKKKKKKKKSQVQQPYLTYANAMAAIHVELDYRAKSLAYTSGYAVHYELANSTPCAWGPGNASFSCWAFLVTDTGYAECNFYGRPGRRWSYEEVHVTARLESPNSWRAWADTAYTFRYWYCFN